MDKIYKLIQNCLLEVEYQDEQWNDSDTARLIADKVEEVMLDFLEFIKENDENMLFNDEILDIFLKNYKLNLFKP